MKKNLLSLLLIISIITPIYAQDEQVEEGNPVANQEPNTVITPDAPPQDTANLPIIENDPDTLAETVGQKATADEVPRTILLDDFETPQGWTPQTPLDFGISRINYRPGSPQEISADNNEYVLGLKTVFFRRNYGWMSIDKQYPIIIPNIVKSFSVWVQGSDRRHKLYFKVRDINNSQMRVPAGPMFWKGWKKVISPVSHHVLQYDPKRNSTGLQFLGFHFVFEAEDIVVTDPYYVYFDYLTAVVNISQEPETDEVVNDW